MPPLQIVLDPPPDPPERAGKHRVVSLSGGVGSWAAGELAIDLYGTDNVTMLFADTLIEDEDLYRFLADAEAVWQMPIVRIAEGRTPWQVFNDRRYIGNTRADPCSLVLKRELIRSWIDKHHPEGAVVVVGIDYTEAHRCEAISRRYLPHIVEYPLIEQNVDKDDAVRWLASLKIALPRLYAMGFPHNNCGGFCVKAGMDQFELLLTQMPERYAEHEAEEEALRAKLGKDVAILRDRALARREHYAEVNGLDKVPLAVPLTMRKFRLRLEGGEGYESEGFGGCGCALDDGEPSQLALDLAGVTP